jgi:PAS domain S-box-containing protein
MRNISERPVKEAVKGAMQRMRLLPEWSRRSGHYGLALLFVAMAAMLRWALPDVLGPTPFLAFYLAWVGAAAFGGLGPGLLAVAASWLCIDLLFDPANSLIDFSEPTTIGRLVVLLAGGLAVSLVAERMRRGRIHERQQSRELADAKQEWERTFDAVPDLIAVVDDQYRILRANRAMAERLGTTPEKCTGLTCYQCVHNLAAPPDFCAYSQCLADGRDHSIEFYEEHLGGHFLVTCSPLFDNDGRMIGSVHVARDITERKRAEQVLRDSEERFRAAYEQAAIGMEMLDLEGRLLRGNGWLGQMLGYDEQELRQLTFAEITHPDDLREELPLFNRLLAGEIPSYSIEKRYLHKEGHPVWVRVTSSLVRTSDPYRISIIEDITERKRAEEAMHEANERLQEQAEELQAQAEELQEQAEELTTANEELRESEQALREREEQLRQLNMTLESKVAQRTVELEHRAAQLQKLTLELSQAEDRERKRLAEILHDDLQQVLAAAKFHLSLMKNRAKHDPSLQNTVGQVDSMLKDAIEKSRSLSHELSPAVLHCGDFAEIFGWLASQVQTKHGLVVHVRARGNVGSESDALRTFLYKAAQELLFNVVKHARVNEARIRIRRVGRWVCLSVSDRGRGFDQQQLREAVGFGLLSIRERVELLGGRMKIKSIKDKGSRFLIIVPDGELAAAPESWRGRPVLVSRDHLGPALSRHDAPVTSEPQAHDALAPATGPQAEHYLRVLLADDHEIVREGLISLLGEEQGIEVVGEAANGREAINLASELQPDVVIMDVSMPLINGDEATRQIKRQLPKTRVVALSMFEDAETVERMRAAGAEAYVLKTAPSEDLLAAIRGKTANS